MLLFPNLWTDKHLVQSRYGNMDAEQITQTIQVLDNANSLQITHKFMNTSQGTELLSL